MVLLLPAKAVQETAKQALLLSIPPPLPLRLAAAPRPRRHPLLPLLPRPAWLSALMRAAPCVWLLPPTKMALLLSSRHVARRLFPPSGLFRTGTLSSTATNVSTSLVDLQPTASKCRSIPVALGMPISTSPLRLTSALPGLAKGNVWIWPVDRLLLGMLWVFKAFFCICGECTAHETWQAQMWKCINNNNNQVWNLVWSIWNIWTSHLELGRCCQSYSNTYCSSCLIIIRTRWLLYFLVYSGSFIGGSCRGEGMKTRSTANSSVRSFIDVWSPYVPHKRILQVKHKGGSSVSKNPKDGFRSPMVVVHDGISTPTDRTRR